MTAAEAAGSDFRHLALLYRSRREYLPAVASFIQGGLSQGCAVLVALPGGMPGHVGSQLTGDTGRLTVVDMTELGRNPARILPAILAFVREQAGRPVYCLGEPLWPGRTAAEIAEATRHESLVNLALRDSKATVVCPYDRAGLPELVVADAARTHPVVIADGRETVSTGYLGPPELPPGCDRALPGPPPQALSLSYSGNLRAVRRFVSAAARGAGLAPARVTDLVIAVSELAANTLAHTASGGTMHIWPSAGELICQVADTGQITDLLARHRAPAADLPGGKGLWIVNQVCDLVQTRTGPAGTTTRLHMRLA